MEENKSLF